MKILVVDDEPLARERLQRLLEKLHPEIECLQAADGHQALAMVADQAPELVLLDIRMPGMDGIEVATHLDQLPSPPALVFCTAYDEYALQALQHQAVGYLLKPVREKELARALSAAGRVNRVQLANLQGEDQPLRRTHVSSHSHRGLETMAVSEVRCFLAEQKYVVALGPEGELLIPDTLKDLEQEFGDRFLRIHRNALVALPHLLRLRREEEGGGWVAELDGVEATPAVSRRHLAEVKQHLLAR